MKEPTSTINLYMKEGIFMRISTDEGKVKLELDNGIELEFNYESKYSCGIKRVTFNGKSLRSAEECIQPEFATPDGLELDHLEYIETRQEGDKAIIVTRPYFRVGHRMEWAEHALHLRINTTSWSKGPFTVDGSVLEWIIKEEKEEYDGCPYIGFSYGFHYHCPGYLIYQIEDKATWELGGRASGNTFIMRNGFNKPVATFEEDTYFYTGWDMPGIANPHIFQHLPLYSNLQGFTFQMDKEDILVTVHERPSHVRSLFLKEKRDNKLLHFNQFCFNLTDNISTPARKILVGKTGGRGYTGLLNHFLRVREKIQKNIRDYYGLKFDRTRPSAHVETWQIAKPENFEPVFKQLDQWGIKRAFVMPLWRSNETEINPRFIADRDKFGFMGNMCCPLELEIADCYGGWEGLRRMLKGAVERRIDTYMWFGSHFSSMTNLQNKIKDIFARDVSGQNNRNNYGHVLWAVNQNSREYQEYLLQAFGRAKDCGLKGVFRDSHFNMASDTINYLHVPYEQERKGTTADQIGFIEQMEAKEKDMIISMHDAEAQIQSRFQNELGLMYYVESQGVLGTPMCGTNYDYVRGYEFIFSDMETGMNFEKVKEYGDDVNMTYFIGLSVRLIYQLNVEVNKFPEEGSVDPWWNAETMAQLTRGFLKAEPYMETMYILEDGKGILWKGEDAEVVFAYKDFEYKNKVEDEPENKSKNEKVTITNIYETTHEKRYTAAASIPMKKMNIYVLGVNYQ
jgi:hypothetical protein